MYVATFYILNSNIIITYYEQKKYIPFKKNKQLKTSLSFNILIAGYNQNTIQLLQST